MKIVLATPLYPPEIMEPAPYSKEVAKRLSLENEVTIVAYAHLPETISGVRILTIEKHQPRFIRLFSYFVTLLRTAHAGDVIYAVNGISVELPVALVALVTRRPLVFYIGDMAAHERTKRDPILRLIESFAFSCAKKIVTEAPLARPEILPFEPHPEKAFEAYEASWNSHLRHLIHVFNHVI
jgi:hypothetical protein